MFISNAHSVTTYQYTHESARARASLTQHEKKNNEGEKYFTIAINLLSVVMFIRKHTQILTIPPMCGVLYLVGFRIWMNSKQKSKHKNQITFSRLPQARISLLMFFEKMFGSRVFSSLLGYKRNIA